MSQKIAAAAVATAPAHARSWFERYSWTVFVLIGALVLLIGLTDFPGANGDHTAQENALNEQIVGLMAIVVAAGGLRRGERWAWYAISVWTLWAIAQGLLAFGAGRMGEAITAVIMLALAFAALALSFRNSFGARR